MKTIYYIAFIALAGIVSSCGIDNFDGPETYLSGNVVYQGEPIQVANGEVRFQLWQPGYGNPGAIDVNIKQDGSYSSLLFDGDYKLIFTGNDGPFKPYYNSQSDNDTVYFTLKGDKKMDIEVTPYYLIKNAQFSTDGNMVTANCNIDQIITGTDSRNVERVTLYLNTTEFVSDRSNSQYNGNIAHADGDFSNLSNISISVDVPTTVPSRNYIYARIGIKIQGIDDMIFSPVEKIDL
ncbi:DUF3823 domain-containing protein [Zhouia sp. PK063]|uniref:DUF3823 domain-containing protein n=1 Tax=Zhouia sp. PK063 TaxID=3373602 RepID=UPI00379A0DFE